MECFDRGLISPSETGGLDIRFGDPEASLAALEMIAYRKGFGDILAEGVRAVSEHIGKGSDRFAMHVKGMGFPGL